MRCVRVSFVLYACVFVCASLVIWRWVGNMLWVERSGKWVASSQKLFTDAKIVSKLREALLYLPFITYGTLVLVELLLTRVIPILLIDKNFFGSCVRRIRDPFGRGMHAARCVQCPLLLFPGISLSINSLSLTTCFLF